MIAAEVQLLSVENGINSGSTISAMYNHTTGPKEKPKFPINIINTMIIKAFPKSLIWPCKINPKAMKIKAINDRNVPDCKIDFLPNLDRK